SDLPAPGLDPLCGRSRVATAARSYAAEGERQVPSGPPVRRPSKARPRARATTKKRRPSIAPVPVTAAELRALRKEIDARMRPRSRSGAPATGGPIRWNPDPEDVQRSLAQLVLTIVEFLRKLMERQAIRRMEQKTLTRKEVEAVGTALMKLEETIREI